MDQNRFENLAQRYSTVRLKTVAICKPLATEDYVVQPVREVSPPKWHLGHTTWFFEQLILKAYKAGYLDYDRNFLSLFNSYYKSAGTHWEQGERGALSRPTVDQVMAYREHVDSEMTVLLRQKCSEEDQDALEFQLDLGLHHEQQHQELLMMDIKRILFMNPELPVCGPVAPDLSQEKKSQPAKTWATFPEGLYEIGNASEKTFSYDNERPRHKRYNYEFSIASDLVTNGEYREFMGAGGYQRPEYWLSKGWEWVEAQRETSSQKTLAPLYWFQDAKRESWLEYRLSGVEELRPSLPVSHINYFEADAFARWKGCRLPTEAESEVFLVSQGLRPGALRNASQAAPAQGPLWTWTSSPYTPYPGFREFSGKVSEYNGKFMCNQYVLKGGCEATPDGHYRHTYRNFYEPHQRWMFSGIRLAKESP